MQISEAGKAFTERREGRRNAPYRDSKGLWTVGVGHLLLPGEQRRTLTDEEVDALYDIDILEREEVLNGLLKVDIDQQMYDALFDVMFNIGNAAFANSTLLGYVNAGRFEEACIEILQWSHAGDRIDDGLLLRRAKDALIFSRGIYA